MLMSNSSVGVSVPEGFDEVYAAQIELRISTLERDLKHLKDVMVRSYSVPLASNEQPWWVKIAGSCADNPLFEDAVRYGQEWRSST
jgi:hypothetical protein